MAEDNFTLTTFYTSWKEYQDHMKEALARLTEEQLALRVTPGLRSIEENALHIIGCRIGWYTETLGEDGSAYELPSESWTEPGVAHTGTELAAVLERTWQLMAGCLARWSSDDMHQTFSDEWDGKPVQIARAWVVWHVIEHDLHHGGEISLTLGMHGIDAEFAL